MRPLLLLRPEPGLSHSARRARALGLEVATASLFQIEPVTWSPPDPAAFDGLLLTSANAARLAGDDLHALRGLPVHAVGPSTAAAAEAAGLRVASTGERGVADLLATLPQSSRLLHLAGRDHHAIESSHDVTTVIVYESTAIERPALPDLEGLVVAVHSPRAAARLARLSSIRGGTVIAAISTAAANACGFGWEAVETSARPDDDSLLVLAARLCQNRP